MKILLWKLGLLKIDVCPIDGSHLTGHGFSSNPKIAGRYTCDNLECKFNE